MPADTVSCPECQSLLRVPATFAEGTTVRCPKCNVIFAIPANRESVKANLASSVTSAVPPPEARPGTEADERIKGAGVSPQSGAEEFWEGPSSAEDEDWQAEKGVGPRPRGLQGLTSEYRVEMKRWFHYADAHLGDVMFPMIGYYIVFFLISLVLSLIPFIGGLAPLLINPPLRAGFTIVALAQLKGKRWSFDNFFGGFQRYGALVGNFILQGLIASVCLVPGIIAMVAAFKGKDLIFRIEAATGLGLGLVILIYLMVRMGMFCTALIIDRECGPVEAIQGNWKVTKGHFWSLLGILLLLVLINLGGALMCGLGLLYTMPYTNLILNAGYLLVAGSRKPAELP